MKIADPEFRDQAAARLAEIDELDGEIDEIFEWLGALEVLRSGLCRAIAGDRVEGAPSPDVTGIEQFLAPFLGAVSSISSRDRVRLWSARANTRSLQSMVTLTDAAIEDRQAHFAELCMQRSVALAALATSLLRGISTGNVVVASHTSIKAEAVRAPDRFLARARAAVSGAELDVATDPHPGPPPGSSSQPISGPGSEFYPSNLPPTKRKKP